MIAVVLFVTLAANDPANHVSVPRLFTDHMVLQREANAPVWGTADPGGTVTVDVGGRSAVAKVDSNGRWRAVLTHLPAGGPYTMAIKGKNTILVHDVLVGDVYVAAGQSNMGYAMNSDPTNDVEAEKMHDDELREFWPLWYPQQTPQPDFHPNSLWLNAEGPDVYISQGQAKKAAFWSAVGYYFGEELRKELHIPIGIIDAAVGGTIAQTWMSADALSRYPKLRTAALAHLDSIKQTGADPGYFMPSVQFDSTVTPMLGYGVKGVLWWQGEGNGKPVDADGRQYAELLPALIADWRKHWGRQLPFYVVQLHGYRAPSNDPNALSPLAFVRDGQLDAVKSVPGTGLVTTIDLPNPSNNIHLIDKADVGLRLARLVLHGQMGPLYRSSRISGSNMIVQFSHVDGGLVASGQNLNCFSIAGSDRHFVWALAKLKNDTVAVSSAQVPQPAAVRYAWADHPLGCNLFNRNGLPASPFRTDAW